MYCQDHRRGAGQQGTDKFSGNRQGNADAADAAKNANGNANETDDARFTKDHPAKLAASCTDAGQKSKLLGAFGNGDGKGAVNERNCADHDNDYENEAEGIDGGAPVVVFGDIVVGQKTVV